MEAANANMTSAILQNLRERQSNRSTGEVRVICGLLFLFSLLLAVINIFWIGGTPTEDCEHHFIRPFLAEAYAELAIALFFFMAVCWPPCGFVGIVLMFFFWLLMFGAGFWKLVACFNYTGWTCREHVMSETEQGSVAWMVCFIFGNLQLALFWGGMKFIS